MLTSGTIAPALLPVLLLLASCQTNSFVDGRYVYLSNHREGYSKAKISEAFGTAAKDNEPVVLFIHGRGNEPKKSLDGTGLIARIGDVKGMAVHKLEKLEVKVLMFSWDSMRHRGFLELDFYDRERPLGNTTAAAQRLVEVINILNSLPRRPKMVLIAHSMGSIVVQRYVRDHGAFPEGLFSNVLLSSADADNDGHADWVQTLTKTARVYVTVNEHDCILLDATDGRDPEKTSLKSLGLDPGVELARGAIYVRLSDTIHGMPKLTAHEAFSSDFPYVRDFYRTVLHGGEVDLRDSTRIAVVKDNVYRLLQGPQQRKASSP
jgi:esterase/lipase superfamily enzyme